MLPWAFAAMPVNYYLSALKKLLLRTSVKFVAGGLLWCIALPISLQAQEDKGEGIPLERYYADRASPGIFRRVLKDFGFGFSTGYANSYLSHDLKGFEVFQPGNGAPQIYAGSTATRYSNWLNDATIDNTPPPAGTAYTQEVSFKGTALNVPLNLFVFYRYKQQYRIGLGYSYDLLNLGAMQPSDAAIGQFQPSSSFGFVKKFYGLVGYSFYRWNEYLFTGDLQVGSFSPSNFNTAVVTPSSYFNLGVTVERDLSEYFKAFVRPSFDFRSFATALPESGKSIDHNMNTLYLSVGVTYRIPELPKCFLRGCRAQINHAHGNKEYRSRRHPIYKKQNPGYGENDKTIIKYKGKNKRKINPY